MVHRPEGQSELYRLQNAIGYQKIVDTSPTNGKYVAYGQPGASKTDSVWAIKFVDTSATDEKRTQWAEGTHALKFAYSNRTSLTYE